MLLPTQAQCDICGVVGIHEKDIIRGFDVTRPGGQITLFSLPHVCGPCRTDFHDGIRQLLKRIRTQRETNPVEVDNAG